jgi:hypothetical protein
MPAAEDLIRSNLCANNPGQLYTLLNTGLGDTNEICDIYTSSKIKRDGVVSCSWSENVGALRRLFKRQDGCEHDLGNVIFNEGEDSVNRDGNMESSGAIASQRNGILL